MGEAAASFMPQPEKGGFRMREIFEIHFTREEFDCLQSIWQSVRQATWARQYGDQWSNVKFYGFEMNEYVQLLEYAMTRAGEDNNTLHLTRPVFDVLQSIMIKYQQENIFDPNMVGPGRKEFELVNIILTKITDSGKNPILEE
jgi:hypothetical protein